MKEIKKIICLLCFAVIVIGCGNNGNQGNVKKNSNKETVVPKELTYEEQTLEIVSNGWAVQKSLAPMWVDFSVNWELYNTRKKVYDAKNNLTTAEDERDAITMRQQFYMDNGIYDAVSKLLLDMEKSINDLKNKQNNTDITAGDLMLIVNRGKAFYQFLSEFRLYHLKTQNQLLEEGAAHLQELQSSIQKLGNVSQKAEPIGDRISKEISTSDIRNYRENVIKPYLNQQ